MANPPHEPMEIELWLLWATLAVALLLWATRRAGGAGRMPPGPTPLPVLGNLLGLRGILHHSLARLARVHGPVMTLKLGLTTAVVVSSRDAAEEAFSKHERRLAAHAVPDATHALGFSGRSTVWLPSSDPLWKSLRGIMATNLFSPRGLSDARGVRERKVRDLVGYFRAHAGREVDVRHAVYVGMLNLVSTAFCSVDVVDVGGESAQGFPELVEDISVAILKTNVSDLFPFLRQLDLQGWRRRTARRLQEVFLILDGIIDSRTRTAEKHGDILDSLLELVSTGKIARDCLTTMLLDLLAGTDGVSVTIEWTMARLLENPSMMAKVRSEIQNVLGGKESVGEADAANMPYLQAVMKEAMRLHPVAPIVLPRQAVEEGVEIGGYAVPKGTTVIFNAWAIMRDPAAWERPDEFVPERFLDMAHQVAFRGKALEFIPFGAGRRLCPALPMAELVMPLILASLVHAFEWQLPDGVKADVSERCRSCANVMEVPLKAVLVVAS